MSVPISTGDGDGWPVATLDPIARLRVLAAGLPGVTLHERRLAAPFDEVWGFVSDLERSIPTFDDTVSSLRVIAGEGARRRIRVKGTWHTGFLPIGFDVDLEPGWCWMVSRPQLYVVGMGAAPDGDGTRYGHLEGLPRRRLGPLARVTRTRRRRHVAADVDGIERALGLRPSSPPATPPP